MSFKGQFTNSVVSGLVGAVISAALGWALGAVPGFWPTLLQIDPYSALGKAVALSVVCGFFLQRTATAIRLLRRWWRGVLSALKDEPEPMDNLLAK